MVDEGEMRRWRERSRIALQRIYGLTSDTAQRFEAQTNEYNVDAGFGLEPEYHADWSANLENALVILESALYEQEVLAPLRDVDPGTFDPELWEHVAHDIEGEHWDKVPAGVATFVESKVREWAGLGAADYGKGLMLKVFKPDGGFMPCGDPTVKGEQLGWQQFATGFMQALSNVDRHRIQNRHDAKAYAIGVLGAGSLILTQLRYQHRDRIATSGN